jgi:hypothetical protein
VIGDPGQRAPVTSGGVIVEKYLGVQFCSQDIVIHPGETARVTMLLMYYPEAPAVYAAVQPGATFTLREGGAVVGYGTIVTRTDE